MSVTLEPAELGFKRPFTYDEVKQSLRLSNSNSDPVAFKVKTTAPKQYCVRPNSGRIEPGQTVEVSVLLQKMPEDPPLDTRCRDKFLVQSVAIPAGQDNGTVTQIWASIEQTAKSSIQERKIRVNFLPADGTAADPNGHHNLSVIDESIHQPHDQPPAYSSPSPVTPQRSVVDAGKGGSSTTTTNPDGSLAATLSSATAAVASATGISQADLQRKLDEANATITRLQQQATEGLRQRNVIGGKSSDEKSVAGTKLQQAPPAGGVSVPVVAMLCFVIFLLTYLFL